MTDFDVDIEALIENHQTLRDRAKAALQQRKDQKKLNDQEHVELLKSVAHDLLREILELPSEDIAGIEFTKGVDFDGKPAIQFKYDKLSFRIRAVKEKIMDKGSGEFPDERYALYEEVYYLEVLRYPTNWIRLKELADLGAFLSP